MDTATRLIEVEREGDTLVLTPQGDLRELDYLEFGEDPEEVLLLLAADPWIKNVVVDFDKTDYLGSTALEFFAQLGKEVRCRRGRLAFCNLSAHQGEILAVRGLAKTWPTFPSREEAIEAADLSGAPAAGLTVPRPA